MYRSPCLRCVDYWFDGWLRLCRVRAARVQYALSCLSKNGGVVLEAPLLARITRRSRDALELAPGLAVYALVKSVALVA
jgi:ABC-type molybdate transport system ATPase subunit